MIKILICDDHPLIRRGIKQAFDETDDLRVVGEAATGAELFDLLKSDEVDVLLLDISLPDSSGLDLLTRVRETNARLPVLMVSIYPEEHYAMQAFSLGAAGYITKTSDIDVIAQATRKVAGGGKYVSPSQAEKLADQLGPTSKLLPHETLSKREHEVFLMLASGSSIKEISVQLELSDKTVSTYRTRLLEKMGFSNNADLTRYALEKSLIV